MKRQACRVLQFSGLLLLAGFLLLEPLAALAAVAEYQICGASRDPKNRFALSEITKRIGPSVSVNLADKSSKLDTLPALEAVEKELALGATDTSNPQKADFVKFDHVLTGVIANYHNPRGNQFSAIFDVTDLTQIGGSGYTLFTDAYTVTLGPCVGGKLPDPLMDLWQLAGSIKLLGQLDSQEYRTATLARLNKLQNEYDDYFFNGYPMYPWEALINQSGMDPSIITDPPNHQWLFAHPLVGLVYGQDVNKRTILRPTLAVEFGYIYYPHAPSKYDMPIGASVFAAITDQLGGGTGAVVHVGKFSLGAVQYSDHTGILKSGQNTLGFVSIELYKAVNSDIETFDTYKAKLESLGK